MLTSINVSDEELVAYFTKEVGVDTRDLRKFVETGTEIT